VAFVFDVFSRLTVGWRAATSMTTELILDTLEMAMWSRGRDGVSDLTGLVHHTDAQYTSLAFTQRPDRGRRGRLGGFGGRQRPGGVPDRRLQDRVDPSRRSLARRRARRDGDPELRAAAAQPELVERAGAHVRDIALGLDAEVPAPRLDAGVEALLKVLPRPRQPATVLAR